MNLFYKLINLQVYFNRNYNPKQLPVVLSEKMIEIIIKSTIKEIFGEVSLVYF